MSNAISVPFNDQSMPLKPEEQQIEAAKRDASAFAPLYEKYYAQIFRFIYRRVADESTAADISSQTFLSALKALSRYEHRGLPFSSWLYRIALNEVNMHFRKSKRKPTISTNDTGLQLVFEEIEQSDIEQKLEKLQHALQQLELDQVQLIELRFFEKRAFKEIGEFLQITEASAKTRTYRLLKKLRGLMENK